MVDKRRFWGALRQATPVINDVGLGRAMARNRHHAPSRTCRPRAPTQNQLYGRHTETKRKQSGKGGGQERETERETDTHWYDSLGVIADGVRSHSSATWTSSSSSSEQNATVFLPPLLTDDPLSLTRDGEVRPEVHGLGSALSSGVMGGVHLRQLLSPRRRREVGASSDMASGWEGRRGKRNARRRASI